jgi:light-regulated signal transduction histidine kinase (bacteriophytochrome)/HPt (histidine-containing phosphotransfer) domain-containing protein/two-component sensor histidine kinase
MMTSSLPRARESARPLDLSGCEREPVHVPGAVQPHGVLLVLDPIDLTIVRISDNAEHLLGRAAASLLGRDVASLAAASEREVLVDGLRRADVEERNPFTLSCEDGRGFSVVAHRHDDRILLECEPLDTAPEFQRAYVHNRVRGSLVRLRATSSLRELCVQTAREISALTGFDRVLVYAFQPDWSGEVVAEECREGLPRYVGLRFPASDIPSQARALYASCRLRAVPTSTYTPARMLGAHDGRPLDLTHASLRSISPVHLEYMRNMGVTASLGISLMDGDRLWGLVTCNHESGERFVPYDARTACTLVGEVVSSLIAKKAGVDVAEARASFLQTQAQLLQFVVQDGDVVRGLTGHSPSVLDVARATGAAVLFDGELHCTGRTPPQEALAGLLAWVEQQGTATVVTDSLPERYPPALAWKDVGCGLVATSISFADSAVVSKKVWILWFRPEAVQTVSWGGDPTKRVTVGERLHPRKSFDRWKEDVHLKSVSFTPADGAAAASLAAALTDVILEIEASRRIRENARLLDASNRELRVQIEENDRVGKVLAARTEQLRQREASLQLVLDATGEGLISVGLDGRLLAERSRAFGQRFGMPPEGKFIWDALFEEGSEAAQELAFMWQQLAAERVPFEVCVDQMCHELRRDGRLFEVGYKAVREGSRLGSVLVTLEDVTERTAARLAAREAAETQAILAWILRDARGFSRTLAELERLARAVREPYAATPPARSLHTLKGNAAVLGLTRLVELCHDLEERLRDRGPDEAVTETDSSAVDAELARVLVLVHDLAGEAALERVEISSGELARAIALLDGASNAEALDELRRWTLVPVTRPLHNLAMRARSLGRELGKDIEVVVVAGDLRIEPEAFEPLWTALVHAVSNAVDHGIEHEAKRLEAGKPARGRLTLSASGPASGWLELEVSDDGGGVDFDTVREAARRRGLPCATRGDLEEALFADALSTRNEVTSVSGRGVGLAALRATCVKMGGTVELDTQEGIGTRVRVRIPG